MKNSHITLNEIQRQIAHSFKPVSRRTIFRYLRALSIEPLSTTTIPRLYPPDTAQRIAEYLGIPSLAQIADLRRRSMNARHGKRAL